MAKTAIVYSQQRWEHVSVVKRTESALAQDLNELGQKGWELVSVTYGKDRKGEMAWTAFMKRPAAQQSGAVPTREQAADASAEPSAETATTESPESSEGFDLSGEEFELRGP